MEVRPSKLVAFAYACFLGTGLSFLFVFLIDLVVSHLSRSQAEGIGALLGFFVLLPLMGLTSVAQGLGTALAIALSSLRGREWLLLMLSGVSLVVWARGSVWPGFCENVWRAGTCTQTAHTLSGIVFLAFGLEYFLFRRFLLHQRRLLLVGLGAATAWVMVVLIFNWHSIANAVHTLWSTEAVDCVGGAYTAMTPECRTRVLTAAGTLKHMLATVAALPVGILVLGAVAALGTRPRKRTQDTEV